MTLAQSTLLLNVNLVFNGFRDDIINLQFLRTWLATLIRPFLKPHSKRDPALLHVSRTGNTYDRWHAWLQAEAHARLVYAFFCALLLSTDSLLRTNSGAARMLTPGSHIFNPARVS